MTWASLSGLMDWGWWWLITLRFGKPRLYWFKLLVNKAKRRK